MKGRGDREFWGEDLPQQWWLEVARAVESSTLLAYIIQGRWHYLKEKFLRGAIRKVGLRFGGSA